MKEKYISFLELSNIYAKCLELENEEHGGFGLEHTFCNDDTAGRNYNVLMQIAYTLWQVFDTGVLSRLSEGCRKPSQEMWAKLLFVAILVLGLASVPRVAVGAMRMRRFHIAA